MSWQQPCTSPTSHAGDQAISICCWPTICSAVYGSEDFHVVPANEKLKVISLKVSIFKAKINTPHVTLNISFNPQATKLFIVTTATMGGVVTTPLGFRVRFKILYRAIQPLIQHCLLRKMVYLNIIYVITTRNYEFFTTVIVL